VKEVWIPYWTSGDYLVDITPTLEKKIEAINKHKSQVAKPGTSGTSRSGSGSGPARSERRTATATPSRSSASRSRSPRPRAADAIPDDLGPRRVLGVARVELVGCDPSGRAKLVRAHTRDVDPDEASLQRLFLSRRVVVVRDGFDELRLAVLGGGGHNRPVRDRDAATRPAGRPSRPMRS